MIELGLNGKIFMYNHDTCLMSYERINGKMNEMAKIEQRYGKDRAMVQGWSYNKCGKNIVHKNRNNQDDINIHIKIER